MTIEPGTIIAGHYKLIAPLGQGGMGEVFSAENTRTGRHVAIKLLRAEAKSKQSAIERFRREARAAGSIKSEFVTQVLDVEDDPSHGIVLVFELLEGESLIERLKRTGPIPWQELWGIVEALWVGLEHAHAADIIHRDLKPSNVYLERRRNGGSWVKILDFGISKLPKQASVETLTQVGQSLGTFSFMPPEQIGKAKSVDLRADIYAATTLVYQALSGKLPYKARNVVHMMDLKRKTEPRTLGEVMRTPVSVELEQFISKGLSRNPDDRFQTVAEALRSWRRMQPPGAPSFCGTVAPTPVAEPPPASSELATIQMSKSPLAPDEIRRMMEAAKAREAPGVTQVMVNRDQGGRTNDMHSGLGHAPQDSPHAAANRHISSGSYPRAGYAPQNTSHPHSAHPSSAHLNAGHSSSGSPTSGQPTSGQPSSGQGQPGSGQLGAQQPNPGQPHSGVAYFGNAAPQPPGGHAHPNVAQPLNNPTTNGGSYPNSHAANTAFQAPNTPYPVQSTPTDADEARRLAGGTHALKESPLAQAYGTSSPLPPQHPTSQDSLVGPETADEEGVSMLALVVGGVLLVAVGFAAVALALRYL